MEPIYIIIHHSAHTEDVPISTIEEWHKQRGFKSVGYHYYIRKNGRVESGRDENQMGAHCRADGMNRKSIGICLAGDFTQQEPTDQQIISCKALVYSIRHRYNIKDVLGHNQVKGASTLCPSFNIEIVKTLN